LPCSWIGLFSDAESGIAYYMWGIGSLPSQVDVMSWENVTSDTVVSPPTAPLSLIEGNTYYVSVKVSSGRKSYSLTAKGAFFVGKGTRLVRSFYRYDYL
jgi:hypothetical protein